MREPYQGGHDEELIQEISYLISEGYLSGHIKHEGTHYEWGLDIREV